MEQPLVSVIIPTYNRLNSVCELVESLYRQTYRALQIILVNDAGESVRLIEELYPELDLTIVDLQKNVGHVQARNVGLSYAQGEYVLLCDDDDLLLPTHVERMLATIADADMVYSDVEIFEYVLEGATRRATKRFVFAYEHDLKAMRRFSTFVSSGCLYRRSLHDRIGLFDAEMHHYWDWDFFLRVSEYGRVERVPAASALYAFAPIGGNMSGAHEEMRPFLDRLSAKHDLGELPTKNFFLLLEEPEMQSRRAVTEVLWDGEPFVSRRVERMIGDSKSTEA